MDKKNEDNEKNGQNMEKEHKMKNIKEKYIGYSMCIGIV